MPNAEPMANRTPARVCEGLEYDQRNRCLAKTAIPKVARSTARDSAQGRGWRGGHACRMFETDGRIDYSYASRTQILRLPTRTQNENGLHGRYKDRRTSLQIDTRLA